MHSYAGIRALYNHIHDSFNNQLMNKASSFSRDYAIDQYTSDNNLSALSIFGGKLTIYRALAENVITKLKPFFPQRKPQWTHKAHLPGGDFADGNIDDLSNTIQNKYEWLPPTLLQHLINNYGNRATR